MKLEICATERALLNYLIARLHSVDADVLVGHNIAAYDMSILLQRLSHCKVAHWSKVGRMRMKNMPKLGGGGGGFGAGNWAEWSVVAGRLMCDTYLSARELLPSQRSYGLKELARSHLNANKPDGPEPSAVHAMFDETPTILQLVRCTENDAFLSLQLMFRIMVLPLTKQLTNLAGNLWTKSLQGKRAERIEYLLLHEFHKLKYMPPDKETYKMRAAKREAKETKRDKVKSDKRAAASNKENGDDDEPGPVEPEAPDDDDDEGGRRGNGQSGRKKPAYAGGLVLEPKRGFYDKYVLLLDFNSLYPSIVQEYNICFTTVRRPVADADGVMPLADVPPASLDTGVLPRLIGMLVARRREVKALLKAERNDSRKTQVRNDSHNSEAATYGSSPLIAPLCFRRSPSGRARLSPALSSTSVRRRSRLWPTRCMAASASAARASTRVPSPSSSPRVGATPSCTPSRSPARTTWRSSMATPIRSWSTRVPTT